MWKQGPMPKDTYNWGGVVPIEPESSGGFYFANFCGDHVIMQDGSKDGRKLHPHEVAWYNNSLEMPPT